MTARPQYGPAGWMEDCRIVERFWSKVDVRPGQCWPWLGAPNQGYGVFYPSPRLQLKAHRVAYQLLVGPIPDDLTLDHLCHNDDEECRGGRACPHRLCVNPRHLQPASPGENTRRGRNAHALSTHCPKGHPYDEANTYVRTDRQGRNCRECHRESNRAWAAERRRP